MTHFVKIGGHWRARWRVAFFIAAMFVWGGSMAAVGGAADPDDAEQVPLLAEADADDGERSAAGPREGHQEAGVEAVAPAAPQAAAWYATLSFNELRHLVMYHDPSWYESIIEHINAWETQQEPANPYPRYLLEFAFLVGVVNHFRAAYVEEQENAFFSHAVARRDPRRTELFFHVLLTTGVWERLQQTVLPPELIAHVRANRDDVLRLLADGIADRGYLADTVQYGLFVEHVKALNLMEILPDDLQEDIRTKRCCCGLGCRRGAEMAICVGCNILCWGGGLACAIACCFKCGFC